MGNVLQRAAYLWSCVIPHWAECIYILMACRNLTRCTRWLRRRNPRALPRAVIRLQLQSYRLRNDQAQNQLESNPSCNNRRELDRENCCPNLVSFFIPMHIRGRCDASQRAIARSEVTGLPGQSLGPSLAATTFVSAWVNYLLSYYHLARFGAGSTCISKNSASTRKTGSYVPSWARFPLPILSLLSSSTHQQLHFTLCAIASNIIWFCKTRIYSV